MKPNLSVQCSRLLAIYVPIFIPWTGSAWVPSMTTSSNSVLAIMAKLLMPFKGIIVDFMPIEILKPEARP